MRWEKQQLDEIAKAGDFRIAPFRKDGETLGTPTYIWFVTVGGSLYVRPYNGRKSRWYKAAVEQKAGAIKVDGTTLDVAFAPADAALNDKIDAAYRKKYADSRYLPPMISERTRTATVEVLPRDQG
ncbi:hypothetical protein GGD81_003052 [Rhodobium orientis]|uniref:DUF2255 domain-containing protein n=1 Tax=Rhodobium orientis TaxID=34017 RepID=A0A327JTD3_9HYPH|nr:DUF2255 family protein [Rhodobium orientis]MBB4303997.1 hypothetical protein [Rhodobium orientis]MBK5950793.1 hypothetical protein [Rhodobium orientis]RAI29537.1 hypothetical protein CH339_02505 [Rhodobium orientis]